MSERINMDPAKTVIEKIGGAEAAARITGKHISRVYRWMYSPARGGTGGVVPHAAAVKLLDHARESNIPLAAEDFIQATVKAESAA
jgi:hypothetical protein